MTDQGRGHRKRSRAAMHFDEFTLAALTVLLLVTAAAVFTIGVAAAEDRIGCGLNDLVNRVLPYPQPCH